MDSKILVNGPVNTVRLEGNVQGKKKVFYSMFDFHVNYGKCDDIHSVDVDTFLLEEFDKLSKTRPDMKLDLMVEIGQIRPYFNTLVEGNYLTRVGRLFSKVFDIDKEKNKTKDSTEIPNVRIHYTDVRDFMRTLYMTFELPHEMPLYPFNKEHLHDMYKKIQEMRQLRVETYYALYHTLSSYNPHISQSMFNLKHDVRGLEYLNKLNKTDIDKQNKKMLFKIRNKYENESVKKIMNNIIDTDIKSIQEKFINKLDQILDEISSDIDMIDRIGNHNNVLMPLSNGIYNYGYSLKSRIEFAIRYSKYISTIYDEQKVAAMFMDLYKLRRFLDKDYITNTISYAGAYHSNNYVRLLIKYFGFKITHYSYLNADSIESAHKIIKESGDLEDLDCILYPKIFTQCSDLTSFPELFT